MMRNFMNPVCLTHLLVYLSPIHYCRSFSTISYYLVHRKGHHFHGHKNNSKLRFVKCSSLKDHIHKSLQTSCIHTSTTLSAGRERRQYQSSETSEKEQTNKNPAKEKLIADEERARQKRMGQMKQRLYKFVSREDRISKLELKFRDAAKMSESRSYEFMPKSERAELEGLLDLRDSFEEKYDQLTFTEEHLAFKAMHNDAFLQLSLYCQRERNRVNLENRIGGGAMGMNMDESINVFFLDGPDGGTASAMIEKGNFDAKRLFVANRHESSCESLRKSGGGMLPDENVVCATAAEALTVPVPVSLDGINVEGTSAGKDDIDVSLAGEEGAFANVDFAAYYFDGCGGFVPHIVGMLSAALIREDCDPANPIAVGYSLLGGNKNVVGKELAISQALTIIARKRGMKMLHVLDDPLRYGLSPDIKKIGGSGGAGTFTTWLLLLPEN